MQLRTAVVIEDVPDISNLISTLLKPMGYSTHIAGTGPAGVRAVMDHRPALITTDLALPGLGGIEVIRAIRAFSGAPLLIITASDDIRDINDALAAGADGYLLKPFRLRALRAHVEALRRREPVNP
ncbi:MAG: DNA-binding response regulator [Pseudarthrobacter sp.]|nr:DNA-binding response regulator [Pseudarthrobacter sp.]